MTGGKWQQQTILGLQGQNQLINTASPVTQSANPIATETLPYGTGPGTVSIIIAGSYLLTAGATVTVNLFDGSTNDITGSGATLRLLRAYAIWISAGGDTSGVTIGNAGSNPHPLFWGSTATTKTIYPAGAEDAGGGSTIVGVAVTSSACNVKIVNNGAVPVTVLANFGGTQCVSGVPSGFPNLLFTYP